MRKYVTIAALTIIFGLCNAQPGPPAPGGGSSPTPFGFVELLIGAGVLFGGKKAFDANKKKE